MTTERARRVPRWLAAAAAMALATAAGCADRDTTEEAATTTTTAVVTTTTSTTEAPLEAGELRHVYVPEVGDCFDRRTLEPEQGGERVVLLLPCELPHTFEVFAVFDADPAIIAARPPLPGVTTTTAEAPAPAAGDDEPPDDVDDPDPDTETVEPPGPIGTPTDADTEGASPDADELNRWPGEAALEREARLQCPPLFAEWVGTPYERSELELGWVLPDQEAWENGSRRVACTVWDPTTERLVGTQQGSRR
ncbi:MAG: septum formation family protein [Acidimicrobiia bacterium]|nr:septum formation family protein [Acidimicrobiia bacterium]